MDEDLFRALVRAAGLERTFGKFPDDVRAAAEQALRTAGAIPVPENPTAEPWPPMRAGTGL
jgi:hypothetical protein